MIGLGASPAGERLIFAPEIFEYQVARTFLSGNSVRLLIHFKRPEIWYPQEADTLLPTTWQEIKFGD